MNAPGLAIVQDRGLAVPPGHVIRTGYVPAHKVKLASRDRMSVGDVNGAYQKRLQLGDHQSWPCPHGHWDETEPGFFVIMDGRHEYVAALMLGQEYLLVAWCEPA